MPRFSPRSWWVGHVIIVGKGFDPDKILDTVAALRV